MKPLDQLTTTEIVAELTETNYTAADIKAELESRVVPNDYQDEAMRGGIRPTHAPTH